MQLPQSIEYALRAMTYLANLPAGTSVRARDLSVVTEVPPAYLSKILRQLVVAGLLKATRGHHGGFTLAMAPRFIRFLDVMLAADFRPDPTHCAFGWGNCRPAEPCPLHPAWSQLNESLCTWAAQTTLADVQVPGGLPTPGDVDAAIGHSRQAESLKQARAMVESVGRRGKLASTRSHDH